MQLALLSAVTYWIANRVASRLQALMGKVCCYVSAWRCGHLRAACNGLRMWCFRLWCRLCFAHAAPSRHAHLATSRHLPPPNYYQRRRRARTAPQASPARTPAIARAKILKSSPLLGSFLGRIFTSWRPGFSHFHKASYVIYVRVRMAAGGRAARGARAARACLAGRVTARRPGNGRVVSCRMPSCRRLPSVRRLGSQFHHVPGVRAASKRVGATAAPGAPVPPIHESAGGCGQCQER